MQTTIILFFYLLTVSASKYGGICDIIDVPYAQFCVPDKVKNMNVKAFNLTAWVNEGIFLVQHESC